MSVRRELASGVFYTSIAKYAGIVVTLVVTGILSRLFTPEQFGVVNIATVVIAFFAIFSDLGIGPAVIQHKDLDRHDLGEIFSLSVWSGAVMALLFFAAAGTIASLYGDSQVLRNVLRILALNLFFAAANIVPNALILKEKRFRFAAMRSLTVQIAGGTAAIAAAYAGAGIYALTINPVFSSLMLLAINYRQNPLPLRLRPGRKALGKVFSFSAYQFSFQLINYFSRNLDKLLMGRYMSLSQLGYYDKSYRLMMLPLQNIAYVISPVMHPIFSEMQHDLKQLGASYLKVVRLLAFIGLPLSAVLFFTAQELVLIIFGDQWEPSVPVFRILALSVGIQIVMSTSGSIFQAANATRMLFLCGVFSAALNVAAICTGIFAFGTTEAVAWCICASFAVNFVQCYHALFCLTLRTGWRPFWQNFLSPLLLTALVGLPLAAAGWLLPPMPLVASLTLKGTAALGVKVVRLLAFIGLPLSAVLFFTAQELVLIIFGDQWEPSVPVFRILALSVGIQIVMSTSGSIFQAANATRMLFLCGVFSAALNVAAICTGIFAFGTTEAVAWCICASFAVNFVQCYHALFCLTLRTGWRPFWQNFLSPLLLTALVGLPLAAAGWLLPPMPLVASLTLKGTAALGVWLLYVHLSGEYDLKGLAYRLLARKNR